MRIIIALAALLLCVFEGFRKSLSLKNRAVFLDEIIVMLGNFSSEIKFRAPTLDELLEKENGRFARLVKEKEKSSVSLKAAWESACLSLGQKNEEAALLSELGKALFVCGSEGAGELLALYSEKFSRLEKEARETYSQKGKAFRRIGTLCGLAAAVIII